MLHLLAVLLLAASAVQSKDYGGYLPEYLPNELVPSAIEKLRHSLSQKIPLRHQSTIYPGWWSEFCGNLYMTFQVWGNEQATYSFDQITISNSTDNTNPLNLWLDFTATNFTMDYSGTYSANTRSVYAACVMRFFGKFASTASFNSFHGNTVAKIDYTSGAISAGFVTYSGPSWKWDHSNTEFTPGLNNSNSEHSAAMYMLSDATDSSFGGIGTYDTHPVSDLLAKALVRRKFASNWFWNKLVNNEAALRQELNALFTIPISVVDYMATFFSFNTTVSLHLPESAALTVHFDTPSYVVLKLDGLLFTAKGYFYPESYGQPAYPWEVKDVPIKASSSFEISGRPGGYEQVSVRVKNEENNITASMFGHPAHARPRFASGLARQLSHGFFAGRVGGAIAGVLNSN